MSGSASPLGFLMPANQNGEVTKARSTNLVVSDLGLLMKGDVVINELQAENEKAMSQESSFVHFHVNAFNQHMRPLPQPVISCHSASHFGYR